MDVPTKPNLFPKFEEKKPSTKAINDQATRENTPNRKKNTKKFKIHCAFHGMALFLIRGFVDGKRIS